MERITEKDLYNRIDRLNSITGKEFELSMAYGGYSLRLGGTSPLNCGHTTKRDLYNRINAFIEGINLGIKLAKNN
jgi:hypothetical protein